jgi:hypothetical protein
MVTLSYKDILILFLDPESLRRKKVTPKYKVEIN